MELFRRIGFQPADKRDSQIALTAALNSWMVLMTALLIWSLYNLIAAGTLGLPFILLGLGLVIYFGTTVLLRGRNSQGDQDLGVED